VAIFDLINDLANVGEVWMELSTYLRRETFCHIVHRMSKFLKRISDIGGTADNHGSKPLTLGFTGVKIVRLGDDVTAW